MLPVWPLHITIFSSHSPGTQNVGSKEVEDGPWPILHLPICEIGSRVFLCCRLKMQIEGNTEPGSPLTVCSCSWLVSSQPCQEKGETYLLPHSDSHIQDQGTRQAQDSDSGGRERERRGGRDHDLFHQGALEVVTLLLNVSTLRLWPCSPGKITVVNVADQWLS